MKRRSFRLIGGEGHVDIELEQHSSGHIEVAELDNFGKQIHPVIITRSWDEAHERAALLISEALRSGRV